MKNTQINKDPKIQKKPLTPNSILLIVITLFSISCTSTQHRRNSVKRIIAHENVVLRALKAERESENISSKLKHDPTLLSAESDLKQAIDALLRANKTAESRL